ncbi:hypothetical protein ACFYUD_33485 [Nocardia tengchongensis]|uniref:hypothetical protein n=1 Tax=Nocardia tengchongensis TaxID=2055889 RepID=UPI0036D090AF
MLLDLYIPTKYVIMLFVRFMYIKQRPEGMKELDFGGVSLQFPLGIGLPIRHDKGTDGVIAVFGASRQAFDRPKRATLTVVNTTTGLSTIAVQETATLEVTLTAYAQPGNYIMELTTACWWKTDAPKAGKNVCYGNAVDQAGESSVCWYGGSSQSDSKITVTPTFG